MISTAHCESVPDDELTEDEFTEALRRRGTDTAPGPDKFRYSDGKNLTEGDRTVLYPIHQESFDKGHIREDWTHRFLKPISKLGKYHRKLNGYRVLTIYTL